MISSIVTSAVKKYSKKLSSSPLGSGLLLLTIIFLVVSGVSAATPNPGHPWTEIGDGLVKFSTPTALRTYTLPDNDATLLAVPSMSQGDIFYASSSSQTAVLSKDTNATRYLSNTGTNNNPAWSTINLTNGISGILASANGGTGNASTSFTGQTLARTYTLPDANATILTSNSTVTLAQGGTGANIGPGSSGVVYVSSTTNSLAVFANPASSNKLLLSTDMVSDPPIQWSGSSYPNSAGSYGNVIVSNGTDFVSRQPIVNEVNRFMSIYANVGANTATNLGFPAAPTLTVTVSNTADTDGPWLNHVTTTTTGNTSGVISAAFTYVRTDWNPYFSTYIKTDATSLATSGYWAGMFSASPDNNPTPAVHGAAFRYYTSADGTAFWRTVTMAGSSASTTISTTTYPIATGTAYQMNIDCTVGVSCLFYINGILVNTHTTNLPASGQTLGYAVRVTNLLSTARNIKWSRLSITHK